MPYRYIPILRWKGGEQGAIKRVSEAGIRDVIPLVVLTPITYKEQKETITREEIPAAELFAQSLYKHWGSRPFFLDASRVEPTATHPLIAIARACHSRGANLIPATKLGAGKAYDDAVKLVAAAHGRNVALRVALRELTSAKDWLATWPHALGDTDLIADFEDSVETVVALGDLVDQAFRGLHEGDRWRSVTIAGTSIPENFAGLAPGLSLLARHERLLWERLVDAKLPYRLDFGDYATQSTRPPPTAPKWGFPINVRYTLPSHVLVCRGVSTTRGEQAKEMSDQLVGHARSIVSYKDRHRIGCWADEMIDKIAKKNEKPGNLETWVKLSINRHIELVRATTP